MDRVFYYAACLSYIVYVVNAQNPCRDGTNNCNRMRETCFVNATAPNGYLCCKFDKERDTYIYQRDVNSPIINCDPLKCIVCDSRKNAKCGVTFGYTDEEVASMKLLVDCREKGVNNTMACRKMVITTGKEVVVTRTCWGTPGTSGYYQPRKCLELEGVESCYCTSHGCNSQGPLLANVFLLIASVILTMWWRIDLKQ